MPCNREGTVSLSLTAQDILIAAIGIAARVSAGEADAIEGWLAYGAALNEGRALFHPDDDKGFGQWVADNLLCQVGAVEVDRHERAAAMWAAKEPEQFDAGPLIPSRWQAARNPVTNPVTRPKSP